jgi:hypothetical protein
MQLCSGYSKSLARSRSADLSAIAKVKNLSAKCGAYPAAIISPFLVVFNAARPPQLLSIT